MTAVALLGATEARAQYENKVKVQPTGRILLDGAIYAPDGALYEYRNADGELISGPSFADGVALPDIRMGSQGELRPLASQDRCGLRLSETRIQGCVYPIQYQPQQLSARRLLRASVRPQRRHLKLDETRDGIGHHR